MAVVLGQPVGPVADRPRTGTLPSAAWYGAYQRTEVAHRVACSPCAAAPPTSSRRRGSTSACSGAARAGAPRRRGSPGCARSRCAAHPRTSDSRADADRDRAEPLLPRARRPRRRRRARAIARRASASHGAGRLLGERHRELHRARQPAASSRSQQQARRRRARKRRARASAAAARRVRDGAATPPCSNAAAPNPLGGSSGITSLRPFTATAPSSHARVADRARAAHPWNDCHGGVTWNGRSAANSRTRFGARPIVLDAVAHARARGWPSAPSRTRSWRAISSRQRHVGRRNRQAAPARAMSATLGVRPGDELAVGEQERLERRSWRDPARACPPRSGSPRSCRRRHRPVSSRSARDAASAGEARAARAAATAWKKSWSERENS